MSDDKPKRLAWVRVVCALSLAGFFYSTGHADESSVLRIGSVGEPQTMDPHRYNLNVEEHILKDLFLGLTTMNATGEIVPGSARSWDVSDDGLVWTFHLRPNSWSDGVPVTAHDFVYSFRRLLKPETAASLAFFLYVIENARQINADTKPTTELGVRAIDDDTLEMRLEKPFPYLPERLFYPTGYPVPRHVIEEHGDDWIKPEHWVSNGPYFLHDWRPHQMVSANRNPHFYDQEQVAIETVQYIPVSDALTSYHRYLANELDIIGDFPAGELENLRRTHKTHLQVSPLLSIMYIVFNVNQPPFDDVRVRHALALAIDREKITRSVLRSDESPSFAMVPDMVTGYDSNVAKTQVEVERARKLLSEAGYGADNPLELTLRYITGAENKQVHVAIASMWQSIGVRTELHHTELKTHFTDLHSGNFEVAQAGWFGENNPEHYVELLWSEIGSTNYGQFHSPAFDKLIELAKNNPDVSDRALQLQAAESVALAEFPVIPLYSVTIRSLVNPRVKEWFANPRNSHGVRYMYID